MSRLVKRKIVKIDEEKCDGCGLCVPACAEGAIEIVDGKARLVSDVYCDGLGDCLGECPQGAISIIEREAEPFDEQAVEARLAGAQGSELSNWPVQLSLVSPEASFLRESDLLIAADCVPFACAGFHRLILKDRKLLVGCPKLDDTSFYQKKLAEIFQKNEVQAVTAAIMEVPCCRGLVRLLEEALQNAGKSSKLNKIVIGIDGSIR